MVQPLRAGAGTARLLPADQFTQAMERYRAGDSDGSEAYCRLALLLDPISDKSLCLMAWIAFDRGATQLAEHWMLAAVGARPQLARCHYQAGRLLEQLGSSDAAARA